MRIHCAAAILVALAALVVRRRPACTNREAGFCALICVLLGFVSLDRALILCFPPPSAHASLLEPHVRRGWTLRRSASGTEAGALARINSFGLRGREIERAKPAGEFRILFLGDSVTFGFGLPEELAIAGLTELVLNQNASGFRVVCLNAGVAGYSTWQEVDYLKAEGLLLKPDLVVLQFSFNDVTDVALVDPDRVTSKAMRFDFANKPHWSGVIRAIRTLAARRLWQREKDAIRWRNEEARATLKKYDSFEAVFGAPPLPIVEAGWKRTFSDLDEAARICGDNRIPIVVLAFPPSSQLDRSRNDVRPQNRLKAWADERDAGFFDVLPAYEAELARTGQSSALLYLDEGHPNGDGSRVMVEAFVRYLRQAGCLPEAMVTKTERR